MPIITTVRINEDSSHTIFISRMEGLSSDPDSVTTYSILVTDRADNWSPSWGDYLSGVHFTHRFGDGALGCLSTGLKTWESQNKPIY